MWSLTPTEAAKASTPAPRVLSSPQMNKKEFQSDVRIDKEHLWQRFMKPAMCL